MAIGKPVPMLDAAARVTGAVDYLVNLRLPGMLYCKVVRSSYPHAKITGIDSRQAEDMPGVAAVLTRENLKDKKLYGVGVKEQPIFAQERVRYVGEPVALVAAEDKQTAEAAAAAIWVDYEELPAVYGELEAVRPEAVKLHEPFPENIFKHAKIRHGDIEAAFAEADEIFEDTFYSPTAQQASLEPHVAAAQWEGDKLTVWTGSQAPYMVKRVLAELFEIDQENVRIIGAPLGGGYGGKGHVRIEPLVAAIAKETGGRPVKLVLTREEEFVTVTKHAATITLKTGVKRDGTLTARQISMHWNSGAYADAGAFLITGGLLRSVGPYRFKAVRGDAYGIYTNLPPAAAYRGAMSSQATWAYESQMDMIARQMGWDPLEFRMKNLLVDEDTFATGESMHDVHFVECLQVAAQGLGWKDSSKPADTETIKHGRGLAVMMKSTVATSRSESRLRMDVEGQVTLFTSTVEMGQGAHTAMAQIAADRLHLPLETIRIQGPDTGITPFDSTTSASRSTSMMGTAVINAADELLRRLKELAVPLLETPAEDLSAADGHILAGEDNGSVSYAEILQRNNLDELSAQGEFSTQFGIDPETGQGISTPHWHQGAGAVELAVDTETGKITFLQYHASSFAGKIVNPALVKLQNDGNVIYGLGPAMLEEMIFDGGQVTNPNFSDYMIPSIRDIPINLKSVSLESEAGEMHGIGEMTLPPVAPAIAGAIEDAVGVRIKDLPITAEKILKALREKQA